jgi:hypothetical protein
MYTPCWTRRGEGEAAGTEHSIEAESNSIAAAATSACGLSTRRRAATLELRLPWQQRRNGLALTAGMSAQLRTLAPAREKADRPHPESWAVAGVVMGRYEGRQRLVWHGLRACVAYTTAPSV